MLLFTNEFEHFQHNYINQGSVDIVKTYTILYNHIVNICNCQIEIVWSMFIIFDSKDVLMSNTGNAIPRDS